MENIFLTKWNNIVVKMVPYILKFQVCFSVLTEPQLSSNQKKMSNTTPLTSLEQFGGMVVLAWVGV